MFQVREQHWELVILLQFYKVSFGILSAVETIQAVCNSAELPKLEPWVPAQFLGLCPTLQGY